jgi:hypothetical protein
MTAAVTSPAQPLMAAVRDAVTAAGVPFGDSRAPAREGSKPWIVAWADAGVWVPRTMTGSAYSTVLTCHCYGLTADSARIAARLLADGWCAAPCSRPPSRCPATTRTTRPPTTPPWSGASPSTNPGGRLWPSRAIA